MGAKTLGRLYVVFQKELRESLISYTPFLITLDLSMSRKTDLMCHAIRMIRTKGEAGTGDVVEAVRHQRAVMSDIRRAAAMSDDELYAFAKELSAPYHLLKETARLKRLPVVS